MPPSAESPLDSSSSSQPAIHERQPLLAQLCSLHQVATLYAFGSRSVEALFWVQGAQQTLTSSDFGSRHRCATDPWCALVGG